LSISLKKKKTGHIGGGGLFGGHGPSPGFHAPGHAGPPGFHVKKKQKREKIKRKIERKIEREMKC